MSDGRWAAETGLPMLAELGVDNVAEAAAVAEDGDGAWTCTRVPRGPYSLVATDVEHDESLVEEFEDNSMARWHYPSQCLPSGHGHRKASYGLEVIQRQMNWSGDGVEASWRRHQ